MVLISSAASAQANESASPSSTVGRFRVGYSSRLFPGLNENDAKTAIRLWGQTLGREQAIPVDQETPTLTGDTEIIEAIEKAKVDGITVLADEYWAIRSRVRIGPFAFGVRKLHTSEQYVLLIRQDNPIGSLAELRNSTLTVMRDSRSSIASVWLETELLKADLGTLRRFWSRITEASSASKAVLPVFFNQAGACLTTRDAFETMVELNPQVGHQLRVLAESPELVPTVFCFRSNMDPEILRRLRLAFPSLNSTVTGRQMLTLFQCDAIAELPASEMDGTCALLDRHRALLLLADAGASAP